MSFGQFVGAVRRRWKFVAVFLLAGIALAAALSYSSVKLYAATSRVFLSTQAATSADAFQGGMFASQRALSYAKLARDQSVLSNVSKRLDLDKSFDELADRVTSTVESQTVVIAITARAETPDEARLIARTVADEVIKLVVRLDEPADPEGQAPITARAVGDAAVDPKPVSPNTPLNISVGALLGLLVGLAGAIARELTDTSLTTTQQIEELTGSNVLVTVPLDRQIAQSSRVVLGESQQLDEAFRVLRTNIQFLGVDSSSLRIVISSAVPGEGKTLSTASLASSLARSGLATLLIDCDFRKPSMPDFLGLERSVGLTEILLGQATFDEVVQSHQDNFSFLATGRVPPNPAEVLQTQSMRDLLNEVESSYDMVLIDAPPLLPVVDAAILASDAKCVLLVVAYGKTTSEQLHLAVERVDRVGGRIGGVILNKVPEREFDRYGYGYGYGHDFDQQTMASASRRSARGEPRPAGRRRGERRRGDTMYTP